MLLLDGVLENLIEDTSTVWQLKLHIKCIEDFDLHFVHELIQDVLEVFLFGGGVLLVNFSVCILMYGRKHLHSSLVTFQAPHDVVGLLLHKSVSVRINYGRVDTILVKLGGEPDNGCD